MITRAVLVVALTLGLIAWDGWRRREWRRTLLALGTFALIFAWAYMGMMLRAVVPLFVLHEALVLLAWLGLLWYLIRGGRYRWWIFLLPALTLALFVAMNFLEGSRYQ